MATTATVEVRITDMDEFKAWVAKVQAHIEELERDLEESEQRYEELLGSVGGVSPH